jgi:hypothetical protein
MGKYLDMVAEFQAERGIRSQFGRAALRPNSEAEIDAVSEAYSTSPVIRSHMSHVAHAREKPEEKGNNTNPKPPECDKSDQTTQAIEIAAKSLRPNSRPNCDQTPRLLSDGRRLWRFQAETRIPRHPPPHLIPLFEYARSFGAVMVADGNTLAVVETWQSNLPPETLHNLAAEAAGIIAILRDESRARTRK